MSASSKAKNATSVLRAPAVLREPPPRAAISTDLPLHEKVAKLAAAIAAANDPQFPRVLVRGNTLVRVAERGELEELDVDSLRVEASRVAQFERSTRSGNDDVDPPPDVARALRSADSAEYGGLPRVDRIVDVPVLSASGQLVTQPGYHPDDRLYYVPAEGLEGVEPWDCTSESAIEHARSLLLDDLLGDFDFVDDSGRANALGLVLVPFVRDFIGDAPTPLHCVPAPQPGVGKTYLAKAALLPGCGFVPVQAATEGDEWRKRITAVLLQGSPAILLDNLREVESGALAGNLTSHVWSDRILGESRIVSLPNRAVWVATGNNLRVSAENAQRMVCIDLDPGDKEVARKRDKGSFRHPDLHHWALDHRRELVGAALTLIDFWRAGINPDTPPYTADNGRRFYWDFFHNQEGGEEERVASERTMGSFERWAEVVGGILAANGVRGFLANRDRLEIEANDELHDAVDFFAAWHGLGREPMEFKDVLAHCQPLGALHDHLPAELLGSRDLEKELVYWLRERKGARHGGYQLVVDGSGHRRRWHVRSTAS